MKEKIYTIPINEAYDADCECPLCLLERKIEDEATEYALGAAMMEPDYRIESNSKGYCKHHFEALLKAPNKLSLALVLQTHLAQVRDDIDKLSKRGENMQKGGLFKKSDAQAICEEMVELLDKKEKSCVVCDKVNHTMTRYYEVLLDMWKTEPEFRQKMCASKGLCLHHLKELAYFVPSKLSKKEAAEFISMILSKQSCEFNRIQEDIDRFILKFDYRNKDMEWGSAKDAPERTIEKIVGYINVKE